MHKLVKQAWETIFREIEHWMESNTRIPQLAYIHTLKINLFTICKYRSFLNIQKQRSSYFVLILNFITTASTFTQVELDFTDMQHISS